MVRNKTVIRVQVVSILEVDGHDDMEKTVAEKVVEVESTTDAPMELIKEFVNSAVQNVYDFIGRIRFSKEEK